MYEHESQIRVRYAETDQMGVVYYGNYAAYYEVARVEALRALGISYKGLEERGVMMPVLEYKNKYLRPARYDDLLTIKLTIPKMPASRCLFTYEVYNQEDKLISVAETTLVFVDAKTGRPQAADQKVVAAMQAFFENN